ncbi:MAG TPA: MDR family MFS transporter, partial [Gaiellales bacterium]|nr:MDR family MFS transporter [Gaiellales bacterium]
PDASGLFTHRQIMTILVGLLLGMFLAALDQTVVSTAIRTIADDLHGYDLQAWATTAFLITSTIATPLYGKLSDMYGRRPFYLFAIAVFVVGSALCGMAQSMYELAAFRAFQGIGAGGLMSLALAIIADIVPPRERSKYQGYFMAVFGTSSVLGPVIGGFLAGQATILGISGWRWIFYVNVPLGILAFLVVFRVLHLPHTRREHRIDWPGSLALITFLVPILIVAEQGRIWGWGSSRSVTCYVIGGIGVVAFFLAERMMGDEALLPIKLFQNRTVGISSIASVILGMGLFGGIACLPLYLQIVKGASPTAAGLLLLPMTLGIMTGSIVSGQLISRTGRYRHFPIIGSALLVLSLFGFHYIGADTPLWRSMILMVVFGVGLGFNMQPLTLAVQNAVSPRDIGVATSSATFTRQIGGTIGTAVFLSILFSAVPDRLQTAFRTIAPSADFQAALKAPQGNAGANQAFISGLQSAQSGGSGGAFDSALNDSSFIQQIDPRLARPFLVGFSEAIDLVFLIGSAVMVVAFVVLWFLPNVELRSGSSYAERGRADADDATAAAAPPAVAH